jgi:hypothetical protein
MICPKCKHEQLGKVECEECGIVFARYYNTLIKKNFDKAVNKYNEKEYEIALNIFNKILNSRLPKNENLIKKCEFYVTTINTYLYNDKHLSLNEINKKKKLIVNVPKMS